MEVLMTLQGVHMEIDDPTECYMLQVSAHLNINYAPYRI
jgi:hypothetical protein